MIGITLGRVFVAAGPALAATAQHAAIIGWTIPDAVAAQRVAGDILATRLEKEGTPIVYNIDIRTTDSRIEDVQGDAHDARLLGVHEAAIPA